MKTKLYFYGSAVCAALACVCAAAARHYASSAYTLWLSQQPANTQLSHGEAAANHLWLATMLGFVIAASVLLFAGLWPLVRRTRVNQPG